MVGIINKKLKSDRGASLMLSLLTFLVCCVLGSVILTSGTVAAGRMATVSDADQRYYSVASAAELVSKELTNRTVKITRTRTVNADGSAAYSTYVKSYYGGVDNNSNQGEKLKYDSDDMTVEYYDDAWTMSFLTKNAVVLMFGKMACDTEKAMKNSFSEGVYYEVSDTPYESFPEEEENVIWITNFIIKHDDGSDTLSEEIRNTLIVKCESMLKTDGTIEITLTNASGSAKYSLILTLSPSFNEWEEITGSEIKKISEASWTVGSIRKVG